ncbi:MAG: hypothetical protein LBJ67_05065 [Planctomycetaceae bacterium]|jgi:sulfatase maturation enzyme AslB (radical SAM superfamily)|nr:hypothetical protein [Planctomycetaceae bacterium]
MALQIARSSFSCEHIISDNIVYILNPMYRMRNKKNSVLLYGNEGVGLYHLHRTDAIILALCNGANTVADIAKLTTCFAEGDSIEEKYNISIKNIKPLLFLMAKSKREQDGDINSPSIFPSDAPILSIEKYKKYFDDYYPPIYDPRIFLPKNDEELVWLSSNSQREEKPLVITWHITSECSTDCKYCYLQRRKTKILSKQRSIELIRELAQLEIWG